MNRRELLLGSLAATAATTLPAQTTLLPQATTTNGLVSGTRNGNIAVFKGIPYGADTRQTRFLPPQKPAPWTNIKPCVAWPPRAPQQAPERKRASEIAKGFNALEDAPTHYHLPADEGIQSEDCLFLNVWTPGVRDRRHRPVLVYLHGGAYNNGTVNAELYDGTRLARRGDAVIVTVNHRLNAFGFLELAEILGPAYKDSGNVGMLDLILSLEWVRDNIREFGGDPTRVTIFGQSGGGAKCATLMAMPAAKGLFHRVLTMSGQQVWAAPLDKATHRAKEALAAMGLATPITPEAIAALTTEQIQAGARTTNAWLPVKDDSVLLRDPFAPDAPPQSASIPMILGNTKDEVMAASAWRLADLTWDALPAVLTKALAEFLGPLTTAQVIAKYRELYPAYKPVDVYVAAVAAIRSWPGQVIEAEHRAATSPTNTWVYQMDYPTPTADGRSPHTLDLAFVFDNAELSPGMVGSSPADVTAAQPLATQMSSMLLAFASTGNPNTRSIPHWPPYSLATRDTMLFDRTTRVVSDPRGAERRFAAEAHYRQPGT
jgi:para-nitrobenzyl esterase